MTGVIVTPVLVIVIFTSFRQLANRIFVSSNFEGHISKKSLHYLQRHDGQHELSQNLHAKRDLGSHTQDHISSGALFQPSNAENMRQWGNMANRRGGPRWRMLSANNSGNMRHLQRQSCRVFSCQASRRETAFYDQCGFKSRSSI